MNRTWPERAIDPHVSTRGESGHIILTVLGMPARMIRVQDAAVSAPAAIVAALGCSRMQVCQILQEA